MADLRDDLETALARAVRHPGVFEELLADQARATATAIDKRRRNGQPLGPLAGELVSVKANIDVRGLITTGGSPALVRAARASADAAVVARLRAADGLILGHSAMTELAESAVGRCPALPNPRDPAVVAGGSSTGDAVAVAARIATLAIATDEGGSARIPAAFCGLIGFRPRHQALPRHGLLPLSPTLDGPALLARDIPTIERAFLALAGATRPDAPTSAPHLAVTSDYIWDECEPTVRDTVWSAIDRLAAHFPIQDIAVPEFHDLAALRHHGDFAAAESAAWARSIDLDTTLLGPLARARIERGDHLPAGDYLRALDERERLITRIDTRTQNVDAILMPTTSMLPPPFAGLTSPREAELNPRLLHTSRLANLLDRAAISLPTPGHPSVGLTLLAAQATDTALLRLAAQVQQILEF